MSCHEVPHHGFVELLVLDSQVHSGGSLPLGLLRCESSGGLRSRDEDSSYTRGEWRTTVRDLDGSLQSFTCSICNSGSEASETVSESPMLGSSSCSSPSPQTALVRATIEAPPAPEIIFLEWTTDAPAPTVRIRVGTQSLPEEVQCSGYADDVLEMEGHAVPSGATN